MHLRFCAVWMWPTLAHKRWFCSSRGVYLPNILQKAELETPADAGCMETISARRTDCTNLFTDPEVCFFAGFNFCSVFQCLVTCGKGYKHRQTWCQFGEDRLDDRLCGSAKPESVQTCQQQECASWQVGPWGQVRSFKQQLALKDAGDEPTAIILKRVWQNLVRWHKISPFLVCKSTIAASIYDTGRIKLL